MSWLLLLFLLISLGGYFLLFLLSLCFIYFCLLFRGLGCDLFFRRFIRKFDLLSLFLSFLFFLDLLLALRRLLHNFLF